MYKIYKIKILIIGNCRIGKTHFLSKLVNNEYYVDYGPTIGVDFTTTRINSYKLCIWELSGNKLFQKITYPYMKDADLVLIFFSYHLSDPYKNILHWEEKVRKYNLNTQIYYVGIGNSGNGKQPAPHIYNLQAFEPKIIKALMKNIIQDFVKQEEQEFDNIPLIEKEEQEFNNIPLIEKEQNTSCWEAIKHYCLKR